MSQITPDQAFELFAKQWKAKDPNFRLDSEFVRDQIMTLVSASMSLLAIAPPDVCTEFMDGCSELARSKVPMDVQERIKKAIS